MPTTSALYSLASSRARPVAGGSSIGVASTQSAAPGPVTPAPICARPSPRTTAARSPLGSLPTCSRTAIVPTAAYRPSSRGTTMTLRASALLCAASTAAWISGSSSRTGTTMPGSTTESASGSTGSFSVSVMPRSTVTALRLFQRSRKSAPSEHSFLESPGLTPRSAGEGFDDLGVGQAGGEGAGQRQLGVPDAAADHHGRRGRDGRVDQDRPVLGEADRGDAAVLHAGHRNRVVHRGERGLARVEALADQAVDVGPGAREHQAGRV